MTKQEVIEELRGCVIENCNDCDGISEIGCNKKCDSLKALDIALECIEIVKFMDKHYPNLSKEIKRRIDWSDKE